MGSQSDPGLLTASGGRCLVDLASAAKQATEVQAAESIVLACATTVEAHVDRVVKALVIDSGIGTSRFGAALIDEVRSNFSQSWDGRLNWLGRGFDISIRGARETQDFLTMVDFRNAVVHGHMRITDIQAAKVEAMINLKKRLLTVLDVHTVGRLLIPGEATAFNVVKVSRAFVYFLDATVVARHPAIMV